jgi:hypothetical protein
MRRGKRKSKIGKESDTTPTSKPFCIQHKGKYMPDAIVVRRHKEKPPVATSGYEKTDTRRWSTPQRRRRGMSRCGRIRVLGRMQARHHALLAELDNS